MIEELATVEDSVYLPRDAVFDPERGRVLWIVDHDSSFVVIVDPGTPQRRSFKLPGDPHFLARPSAIAFGASGTFATSQEEDRPTEGEGVGAEFMGPTLWPSDLRSNDGSSRAHLDMLHNTRNGAGIAWERDNVYWVFDGYANAITRYDFQSDHGPGGHDHSDGRIWRYVEGSVTYVEDVGAHMEMEPGSPRLFIADPGNRRVAVLDTSTGTPGEPLEPNLDRADLRRVDGASISTFADASTAGLERPSGLAMYGDYVLVGDHATSRILAFRRATAELVDWVDLADRIPTGSLAGLSVAPDGGLVVVDSAGQRVLRIRTRDSTPAR